MLVSPAEICVGVSLGEITETSMVHHYALLNENSGRVVAEGEAELVFIDFKTGKRAPIDPTYLQKSIEYQERKP